MDLNLESGEGILLLFNDFHTCSQVNAHSLPHTAHSLIVIGDALSPTDVERRAHSDGRSARERDRDRQRERERRGRERERERERETGEREREREAGERERGGGRGREREREREREGERGGSA